MGWLNPRPGEVRDATGGWVTAGNSGAVSVQSATHLVPVFAAIRSIVDYVSTVPVTFHRENPDGTKTLISPPALIQNVSLEYGTLGNWLGQAAYGIATRGNAVGRITAVGNYTTGQPTMIEWAMDWSANDYYGPPSWFLNGAPAAPPTVAHIPWLVPNGRRLGMSPIQHGAVTMRAALSAQEYADVKRGGGIPPAILKNNMQVLDAAAAGAVQDRAVSSFASGKPFVSGKDWDLSIVSIPPVQAQFIEVMKMSASQIAALYGIDPREVGGEASDSLSYTNDESRALNRAHNMRPYLARIENAVSSWLPGGQTMRFDIGATIRADVSTQTAIIGAKIADGRLSVNEARAMEDKPPVDGGDYHDVPSKLTGQQETRPGEPS